MSNKVTATCAANPLSSVAFYGNTEENLAEIERLEFYFAPRTYTTPCDEFDCGYWGGKREYSLNGVRWFLTFDGREVLSIPDNPFEWGYVANALHSVYREMYEEMYCEYPSQAPQAESVPLAEPALTYDQLERNNERLAHKVLLFKAQIEELADSHKSLRKELAAAKKNLSKMGQRFAQARTRNSQNT